LIFLVLVIVGVPSESKNINR